MVHATRRAPSNRNAVLRRGLRGTTSHIFYPLQGLGRLGDTVCDDDGNCYDTGSGELVTSPAATASGDTDFLMTGPNPTAAQIAAGMPTSSLVTTNPAYTGGLSTTSLAASLAASAAQIAAPIIKAATQQAPYYITNPATGQSILYNPNTGSTAGTFGASLSTVSPMVWVLGIGLVGLLAFSGKK